MATVTDQTVWRFEHRVVEHLDIEVPAAATVLLVRPHRRRLNDIEIWVQLDPTAPVETRRLVLVGTGQPVPPDAGRYVGTVFVGPAESFVFHLYEQGRTDV